MGAAEQQRIITRYNEIHQQTRDSLSQALLQLWRALTNYRAADADQYVAAAVPLVLAAQQRTAALTEGYLAALQADMTGRPARARGVDPDLVTGAAARRGAQPEDVYRRPFDEVYNALHEGQPLDTAAQRGERRATLLGLTDLELSKRQTAHEVLRDDEQVSAYRRVLTGNENCGLCVVASTQRYHRGELLPIHPGCDCGVAQIIGGTDPGQVIDQDLLDQAHAAIEQRFGQSDAGARVPDYRKVLLVREHGEYGPVLTVASHRFTGEDDLAAS